MKSLENFLACQRSDGTFISQGTFAVDFERALKKRSSFSLPEPQLWIIRLLQSAFRFEAQRVEIFQERFALTVKVSLQLPLSPELSFQDLFRLSQAKDPRAPLQDAVWGAIGKDYAVEMEWAQGESLNALRVCGERVEVDQAVPLKTQPFFSFKVVPSKPVGLLARIFRKADFSGEFSAIAQRGFLCPCPLYLDNRPYDFTQAWQKNHLPIAEIRAARATSGPRIRASKQQHFEIRLTGKEIEGLPELIETGEQHDYLYLLNLSWLPSNPKRPRLHWVLDGYVVETAALYDFQSPLDFELYLPADGLGTDLSNLLLIDCPAKRERRDQLLLYACFCLLTTPLTRSTSTDNKAPDPKALEKEIRRFLQPVGLRHGITTKDISRFENAAKVFQRKKAEKEAQSVALDWRSVMTEDEYSQRKAEQESLNRWTRFMSYRPPPGNLPELLAPPQLDTMGDFFGDYYVRLPKTSKDKVEEFDVFD